MQVKQAYIFSKKLYSNLQSWLTSNTCFSIYQNQNFLIANKFNQFVDFFKVYRVFCNEKSLYAISNFYYMYMYSSVKNIRQYYSEKTKLCDISQKYFYKTRLYLVIEKLQPYLFMIWIVLQPPPYDLSLIHYIASRCVEMINDLSTLTTTSTPNLKIL